MTFDDRMRRRARISGIAKIAFALFAAIAVVGSAGARAWRMMRGPEPAAPAAVARTIRIDVAPDRTTRIAGVIVDDRALRRALREGALETPRARVSIHAHDLANGRVLEITELATHTGLAVPERVEDPDPAIDGR